MIQTEVKLGKNLITITEMLNISVKEKGGRRGSKGIPRGQGQFNKKNTKQSDRKAIETIKDLIRNNFTMENATFVTLTFNMESWCDVTNCAETEDFVSVNKECNKRFQDFIRDVKKIYNGVHYVAVPEIQKERNVIHYHLVWNIQDLRDTEIEEMWKHGMVKSQKVYDEFNLAKYMTKEIWTCQEEGNVRFSPHYLRSQGLSKSEVVKSWKDEKRVDEIVKDMKKNGNLLRTKRYSHDNKYHFIVKEYASDNQTVVTLPKAKKKHRVLKKRGRKPKKKIPIRILTFIEGDYVYMSSRRL